MGGFTKEQRAAKAAKDALVKKLVEAGLTEEQFEALSEDEKAAIVGSESDDDDSQSDFVEMVRDESQYPAPHTAQVHPDEVMNYAVGGWTLK